MYCNIGILNAINDCIVPPALKEAAFAAAPVFRTLELLLQRTFRSQSFHLE